MTSEMRFLVVNGSSCAKVVGLKISLLVSLWLMRLMDKTLH